MATYKGVNKTIVDNITPATVLDPGLAGGRVRIMYDTFTVATAVGLPTTTDVIEVGDELPTGAKVIDVVIWNGSAARELMVGDYEDTDRYNADAGVAALERTNTANIGYEVDMTTASTPDNQIILTPLVGAMTNAEVVKVAIIYTVE